jgi:hypothetical protein
VYRHLDAAQLVKHALRLRTLASRDPGGRHPWLVYLYAEPQAWPDGRPVDAAAARQHAAEVMEFADAVAGAEVGFAGVQLSRLAGGDAGVPG